MYKQCVGLIIARLPGRLDAAAGHVLWTSRDLSLVSPNTTRNMRLWNVTLDVDMLTHICLLKCCMAFLSCLGAAPCELNCAMANSSNSRIGSELVPARHLIGPEPLEEI
jgi:hypothetical protein